MVEEGGVGDAAGVPHDRGSAVPGGVGEGVGLWAGVGKVGGRVAEGEGEGGFVV